jgi:phosphoglycolate phosphatase
MDARTILVLFDIDGTLLQTLGAGIRAMNAAFGRLYNRPDALDDVAIAGRTDLAIVTDACRTVGVDASDAAIAAVRDLYFQLLPQELARPAAGRFGILPGVCDLLDAIDGRRGMSTALLTGNFIGGARIKLGHFDLWRRFAFGAFGDGHLDRRDLVPVALAEAAARGLTPDHVIVIGDTPLDIDCAHAHGAAAVAVATGPYTRAQLDHADLVVETLEAVTPGELASLIEERR